MEQQQHQYLNVGVRVFTVLLLAVIVLITLAVAHADEKTVLLDDLPRDLGHFRVAADGSKLYFAAGKYLVFDPNANIIDRIGTPEGSTAAALNPLPDGWFIACDSYGGGHLALCRPDGTEAKRLVGKGGDERSLRGDMTGWTSPTNAVVDVQRKLIFALDLSMAPAGTPTPIWSRIAKFDFDGKYVGDINRYDGNAADKVDSKRTWYDDIAIDPARQRVYVTAQRTHELLAFTYDGAPVATAPGAGGVAVFPDGRIAVCVNNGIQLYSPEVAAPGETAKLQPLKLLQPNLPINDLETDATGRLYASINDPTITFLRWPADLHTYEALGPRYQKIVVDFPDTAVSAGNPFSLKVKITARPALERTDRWQVMARPSDGSNLRWQMLPANYHDGLLDVLAPEGFRGLYEVAVRFGEGPIAWADRQNDLYLQKTFAVLPPGAARSVAVITLSGRTIFRQGEAVLVQVIRRDERDKPVDMQLKLEQDGRTLATLPMSVGKQLAAAIPAAVTRRLAPGRYLLRPAAGGHECYALPLEIAQADADSPLQRILYHEFDNESITMGRGSLADDPEQMSYVRDYTRTVSWLGFNRETDRYVGKLDLNGPTPWRRDNQPANISKPGYAVADYYASPHWGQSWQAEYYLDQALKYGIRYDSQLLPHCGGVRLRDETLAPLDAKLQRSTQWFGRYPAFYGFNYNDELFFGSWANPWEKADDEWLKSTEAEQFKGKPHAETLLYALGRMYDNFNAAVRQVNPAAKTTATPMWQFPAVEGSYPPVIYHNMSESYSHYLSEGYQYPWYPAHSVEILRRPGLPLMGVFDNGYGSDGGDIYVKNLLQVVARGVQGAGVEHTRPFDDPRGASAYRTANQLVTMYGPLFAEFPPANEGAILYSLTQDISEGRSSMGTPEWERVFTLFGAGLMAGVPMNITMEEDVAAGWLLVNGKPRVPMFFLVGLTKPLPEAVQQAIAKYSAAGGKVFIDADSTAFPGATQLPLKTHILKSLFNEGYASDTIFPLFQPVLERLATELKTAVGRYRRFAFDSDDPWVSKNQFDGGAIRYLMIANETSPYPWDAGAVWSLGAMYCKNHDTYLPKSVNLTFPLSKGVVYDVFEHALVQPVLAKGVAQVKANLTTFPGRLYAVAPAPLGAPRLATAVQKDTLYYRIAVVDATGKNLSARVPLRLRLLNGAAVVQELYRGTGADGVFAGSLPLPLTAKQCTLEVTELLGGKASVARAASPNLDGEALVAQQAVDPQREAQIRNLLQQAKAAGTLTLVMADDTILAQEQLQTLTDAMRAQGIALELGPLAPKDVKPGVYLAAGYMQGFTKQGELLSAAWSRGLYDYAVSEAVPGPGRGFFTAVFSPRGYGEHCIALVGGDADGLQNTVNSFAEWVKHEPIISTPAVSAPAKFTVTGQPAIATLPVLHEMVGAKLSGVKVAADGTHLLVTADGYLRNAALLEDAGAQAIVQRTARIGQAPLLGSPYLSADGKLFGASGREVTRYGQGFHLVDAANGATQTFAAFGDMGSQRNLFAVASDGNTVIAPGTCGVVCWKRNGNGWQEAWAQDYWQEFDKLDWPVSETAERVPQFHAVIPRGADYALILFGEFSPNGWITPENYCSTWLAAVNLSDGKERWRFTAPVLKTLLFPTLYVSPDGTKCLLQVQLGSWGKETFRFYSIVDGKAAAEWNSKYAPQSVVLADGSGLIATTFKERLLEVRRPDGTLINNLLWANQPVSVAFAADGRGLYVSDDAGRLTRLDAAGKELWHLDIGCVSTLASSADHLYAAGWDGRLRAYNENGQLRWVKDCTPDLTVDNPMVMVADVTKTDGAVLQAKRAPTTIPTVLAGENLLRNGAATLTVGGTHGWMSGGTVQVKAEELTNGKLDDVSTPWLHMNEVFWDGPAGWQVWAEIAFKTPTDVSSLTVYENPNFPDSWPSQGLVQVWNDETKQWNTVAFGNFLNGPVNTYQLSLKGVAKLRYLPWNSYYRNFYTSEIEVRAMH